MVQRRESINPTGLLKISSKDRQACDELAGKLSEAPIDLPGRLRVLGMDSSFLEKERLLSCIVTAKFNSRYDLRKQIECYGVYWSFHDGDYHLWVPMQVTAPMIDEFAPFRSKDARYVIGMSAYSRGASELTFGPKEGTVNFLEAAQVFPKPQSRTRDYMATLKIVIPNKDKRNFETHVRGGRVMEDLFIHIALTPDWDCTKGSDYPGLMVQLNK
jgi:hypothetical protein